MHPPLKSLSLLILLGIVWGSGYSIARYCMTHGVLPLGYSFWQSIGPAIVLGVLCLIQKDRCLQLQMKHLKYYFFCGLIGISLPNSIMYFGAAHLPSSILTVLVNTVPLMVYPLSLLSKQERFMPKRLLALAIGLVGIFWVVLQTQGLPRINNVPWTLIVLLTPFCFAICVAFINPLKPQGLSPLQAAAGILIASSIILLPLVMHTDTFFIPAFNKVSLLILVEIALSSFGYVLFFKLLQIAGPVYYSLVGGMVTLTGLFWGYILFGEILTIPDYCGVVLILVGILTLSFLQERA